MISQGLKFHTAGEFFDWYTTNDVFLGIVVDNFFLGRGKVFKANFEQHTITDQEMTRDEFERICDEQTLSALGLMATMYLVGYTQAIETILSQTTEQEQERPALIITPSNGKFKN